MEIPILQDILIILGLSILIIFLFKKLNLPTILGFLLTGIIVGPKGLSLISAVHEVEILSEIGIVLLLFIIGIEFSISNFLKIKNAVLLGGFIQVGLTIAVFFLLALYYNFPWNHALFLGFLFSMSSTAIVLSVLQSKAEVNSPHGKISLAILIFQDIIVVPMMLFAPIIAGQSENALESLLLITLKAALVIVVLLVSARYVVPKVLYEVAKVGKEIFLLAIVVICFAVAWVTSEIGLSLALGAFMAGLTISESEYSHQATGIIMPLKEIFTSFFFISIGMLLDISFLYNNLGLIVLLTLGVIVLKTLVATLAAFALKYPARPALLTGFTLFQIGEFAFILSKAGLENQLISNITYQYFLAISVISMGITPFIIYKQDAIFTFFAHLFFKRLLPQQAVDGHIKATGEKLENHVLIIGYGLNGQNVAKAAKFAKVPYVIVEMNASTVKKEKAAGEPIIYGDPSMNIHLLEHLNIYGARVVVIAISDTNATKKMIFNIRSICKTVHIIVRTRFVTETESFLRLGANEVIPEEFETSIEIFTRVLSRYLIPRDEIESIIRVIREDNYEMLRPYAMSAHKFSPINLPEFNIICLKIESAESELVGKKIAETNIRSRFNLNILAIQRDGKYISDIEPDTEIKLGDVICFMGKPENFALFEQEVAI